ncbi:unnamed protein product [Ranitomeya imitator]|uniref:Protein Wnt n=1 Tax=Ranitomeya imitator TaxID=111125 RepID=A0ABN9M2J4_9NEOB|nr:unnamed protein product [Ranitomeya imitator]
MDSMWKTSATSETTPLCSALLLYCLCAGKQSGDVTALLSGSQTVQEESREAEHSAGGQTAVGSRESAFVYAISSAGVVFAITRACSQGELKSCSCDPKKKGSSKDSRGSFDWGGCSDNIDYGIRFARSFVDAREKKGKDARALMNVHNNRVGRKAVKRFMTKECKCHGVSGSCTLRTCWLTMGDFRKSGDLLRKKYNGAIQVVMNQDGTGFTVANKRFNKPTTNDLVYFENSPDYCNRDRDADLRLTK